MHLFPRGSTPRRNIGAILGGSLSSSDEDLLLSEYCISSHEFTTPSIFSFLTCAGLCVRGQGYPVKGRSIFL